MWSTPAELLYYQAAFGPWSTQCLCQGQAVACQVGEATVDVAPHGLRAVASGSNDVLLVRSAICCEGPLMSTLPDKLVIAISSRALFNLNDSHRVFEEQGLYAFSRYQVERENDILDKGDAFPLVEKFLKINKLLGGEPRVEVILLSRNSADTGLRIFNSIEHYGLDITRAAFCNGESPYRYIGPFGCDLFLSTDGLDVRRALEQGVAAATLVAGGGHEQQEDVLRFAFDGDAVIFSDEAEQVYKRDGLAAFTEVERASAQKPLGGGPFKGFLEALQKLQAEFEPDACPIRTALVTARSAPAHERVIRTLRAWDIRVDESVFLGGLPKGAFLRAFGADVFFDDQLDHCASAAEHVATGHVPHGIANIES